MASTPILLDEPELARVLIEKRFISRKAFVGGDIRFTLADRRNRNVKITLAGAGGLFTKQAKTREALTTLRREASALGLLNATQDGLTSHLPRKIAFDPDLGLLVIVARPKPPPPFSGCFARTFGSCCRKWSKSWSQNGCRKIVSGLAQDLHTGRRRMI